SRDKELSQSLWITPRLAYCLVAPLREIWNLTVVPNSYYANVNWIHNFPTDSKFVLEVTLDSNNTVTLEEVKQPPFNLKSLIAGEKYHLRVYSKEISSVSSKFVTFKTKAGERTPGFSQVG
ncbi:hypothetical protein CHARACLAT_028222, partial [Characodon lateralis]|nr:hypothetical protein [Characodon lateralis]